MNLLATITVVVLEKREKRKEKREEKRKEKKRENETEPKRVRI